MDYSSIYHMQMSNYAFATSEEEIHIRLRVKQNEPTKIQLCYGDTAFKGNPVQVTKKTMNRIATDLYFDYYEAIIKHPYKRLVYYFELQENDDIIYYYSNLFHKDVTSSRNELYKFPYIRKEDIVTIPSEMETSIVYNIFPDSFASTKEGISKVALETYYFDNKITSKHGGTITGIKKNLDYIKRLGANTVYLNPIFMAGEYHKYDIIDYFKIDSCFGTNEEFKELVDEIHSRDMKIVIDGVFNHCGWHFFAFDDCIKHQEQSPYRDWFYDLDFPIHRPSNYTEIPKYACFGYEKKMPKLNTSNKEVIKYFTDVATYWTREYQIDGWRLDVADEVNLDFWRIFRKAVKEVNEDCQIIGEVWQSAEYFLDGSMFDSVMNYDFLKHSRDFFAYNNIDAESFSARVTHMYLRYRKTFNNVLYNLLDSHDTPRFFSLCGEDLDKYTLATLFLFTCFGIPMIFYGDEQGISGIKEDEYRKPMTFSGNPLLYKHFQKLALLRNHYSCLRDGDYETIYASQNVLIFKRYNNTQSITIIINNSTTSTTIESTFLNGTVLYQKGFNEELLESKGFVIILN